MRRLTANHLILLIGLAAAACAPAPDVGRPAAPVDAERPADATRASFEGQANASESTEARPAFEAADDSTTAPLAAPSAVPPTARPTGPDDEAAPDEVADRASPPSRPALPSLPDLGPAPELAGEPWLNAESPRDLAALRGKVVLVEFWTFGCINCRNVLPHVARWHDDYAGERFEVVGVYYPEFDYERDLDNVRGAVAELGVAYPVAVDNDGTTWRAWQQRYWPTLHLVDHRGRVRYTHIGEGAYEATEAAIQALIAEAEAGAEVERGSTW